MENRVVLVPKQTTVKLSDEKIKKSELVEKEVPFGEPVVLEDDTLEEGNTKEVSKGKNGIDYYDQNGVLVKQKQPVAPVILKGTKPKVSYNFIERTVKKDFKDFETQYINDDTMSIDAEPIVEKLSDSLLVEKKKLSNLKLIIFKHQGQLLFGEELRKLKLLLQLIPTGLHF